MLPQVRKALQAIDDVLVQRDQAARDLAAILSMLRSEDHNDNGEDLELKEHSTMPIRAIAFPKLKKSTLYDRRAYFEISESESKGWAFGISRHLFRKDEIEIPEMEGAYELGQPRTMHFYMHLLMAIEAIGRTKGEKE